MKNLNWINNDRYLTDSKLITRLLNSLCTQTWTLSPDRSIAAFLKQLQSIEGGDCGGGHGNSVFVSRFVMQEVCAVKLSIPVNWSASLNHSRGIIVTLFLSFGISQSEHHRNESKPKSGQTSYNYITFFGFFFTFMTQKVVHIKVLQLEWSVFVIGMQILITLPQMSWTVAKGLIEETLG